MANPNLAKLKKKAAEFEQKKQFDRALSLYIQLLEEAGRELDDADLQLFNRVGDLLQRQGNVSEALAYYEKAVDVYAERGFLNNAIALCNKVLRQSPARTSVYYKLGKISATKGFKSDAKKNFLEYADRMQKAGHVDEAFRALKEFADLCPDQDDIRLMLAEALQKENRNSEAVEQLETLYIKLEEEGRAAEARATIDRIKAIDPTIVPRASGSFVAQKSNDLVFLDLDHGEPAPSRSATPTGPAASTPASSSPRIGALEGLILTFDPDEVEDAAPVDGLETTSQQDEPTVALEATAVAGLEALPGASTQAPLMESVRIIEEDAWSDSLDPVPLLSGLESPRVSLTGTHPALSPLIDDPPLSGREFSDLPLRSDASAERAEAAALSAHDLSLPSTLPMLADDGASPALEFIAPGVIDLASPQSLGEVGDEGSSLDRQECGATSASPDIADELAPNAPRQQASFDAPAAKDDARFGAPSEYASGATASRDSTSARAARDTTELVAQDGAARTTDELLIVPAEEIDEETRRSLRREYSLEGDETPDAWVEAALGASDDFSFDHLLGSPAPSDAPRKGSGDADTTEVWDATRATHQRDAEAHTAADDVAPEDRRDQPAIGRSLGEPSLGLGPTGEQESLPEETSQEVEKEESFEERFARFATSPDGWGDAAAQRPLEASAGARAFGGEREPDASVTRQRVVQGESGAPAPSDSSPTPVSSPDEMPPRADDAIPAGYDSHASHETAPDSAAPFDLLDELLPPFMRHDGDSESPTQAAHGASSDELSDLVADALLGADLATGVPDALAASSSALDVAGLRLLMRDRESVARPDGSAGARDGLAPTSGGDDDVALPLIDVDALLPGETSSFYIPLDLDAVVADDILGAPPAFGQEGTLEFEPGPLFDVPEEEASGSGTASASDDIAPGEPSATDEAWSDDEVPEVLIDGEWHNEHMGDLVTGETWAIRSPADGPPRVSPQWDDLEAALLWPAEDDGVASDAGTLDRAAHDPAHRDRSHAPRRTLSFGGVEAQLRRRLELDPANVPLRQQLGEALMDLGNREGGLHELDVAMLGFEQLGDLERARGVAEIVLRAVPSSVRHHQKRVEYAVRTNDRVRLVEAYVELADSLFRGGEAEKARVVYSRVLELSPGNGRARFALGLISDDAPAESAGGSAHATSEPPSPSDMVSMFDLALRRTPVEQSTSISAELPIISDGLFAAPAEQEDTPDDGLSSEQGTAFLDPREVVAFERDLSSAVTWRDSSEESCGEISVAPSTLPPDGDGSEDSPAPAESDAAASAWGSLAPMAGAPAAPETLTPASSTPVTLTPVGLTPVTLTPVALTPVALTPVAVSPVSLTPVALTPVLLAAGASEEQVEVVEDASYDLCAERTEAVAKGDGEARSEEDEVNRVDVLRQQEQVAQHVQIEQVEQVEQHEQHEQAEQVAAYEEWALLEPTGPREQFAHDGAQDHAQNDANDGAHADAHDAVPIGEPGLSADDAAEDVDAMPQFASDAPASDAPASDAPASDAPASDALASDALTSGTYARDTFATGTEAPEHDLPAPEYEADASAPEPSVEDADDDDDALVAPFPAPSLDEQIAAVFAEPLVVECDGSGASHDADTSARDGFATPPLGAAAFATPFSSPPQIASLLTPTSLTPSSLTPSSLTPTSLTPTPSSLTPTSLSSPRPGEGVTADRVADILSIPLDEPATREPDTDRESGRAEPAQHDHAPDRGSDDGDFVDLGSWLRDDEPVRSTRMVTSEAAPTGDEQADFDEMLRRFKHGVAANVDEEDFASHYDLGVAYKEMGLTDEAIAEFQKSLRGDDHRVRSYEALGQCFVEKGQLQVAGTLLQRAVETTGADDRQLVGVLYLLGYASEVMARHADALRYYQRVFAVDIEFRDVAQRVAAMEQRTQ